LWVNNRILGAGGGFFIPALLFFANLPMKQAVGTSLFIIFINSLIGFGGDLIGGVELNYKLLFIISAMALFGIIGTQISKKIDGTKLKPAFGWFVLIMGIYRHRTFLYIKFYVTTLLNILINVVGYNSTTTH
jgi:uncharacterized membrane protein YfcA